MKSLVLVLVLIGAGLAQASEGPSASLEDAVREAETAFARTMADRDHARFTSFLHPDAVFLGNASIMRGATQVAEGWKPYFEGARAPFSWSPDRVAVAGSGDLAVSTGPVSNPDGKVVGTFVSTWRRGEDGTWKIILDSGCRCPVPQP